MAGIVRAEIYGERCFITAAAPGAPFTFSRDGSSCSPFMTLLLE
jgi:hypothetical protein